MGRGGGQAALGAWLDSESQYRLTVEKTKEADEGSRYAQQQYEKYHTAYTAARTVSDGIARSNAVELADLLDERDLIKEIMRMIGAARVRSRIAMRGVSCMPPCLLHLARSMRMLLRVVLLLRGPRPCDAALLVRGATCRGLNRDGGAQAYCTTSTRRSGTWRRAGATASRTSTACRIPTPPACARRRAPPVMRARSGPASISSRPSPSG